MSNDQFILTPTYIDTPLTALRRLAQPHWWINDPPLAKVSPQDRLIEINRLLRDLVSKALSSGRRPVSIAGDCCTAIGTMAGLQSAGIKFTLIWFDAHGDFNTWETSPSGFLGGMPLAMLVGRGEQTVINGVGLGFLDETQVILSDARDLDPAEKLMLLDSSVQVFPAVSQLLNIDLPEGPLYIHFDTDLLDPVAAPAMNYLAPGGPDTELIHQVFSMLASSGRIVAVSVSSWNPALDEDGKTEAVVMNLLKTLLS